MNMEVELKDIAEILKLPKERQMLVKAFISGIQAEAALKKEKQYPKNETFAC